jgi:hypothetical protein
MCAVRGAAEEDGSSDSRRVVVRAAGLPGGDVRGPLTSPQTGCCVQVSYTSAAAQQLQGCGACRAPRGKAAARDGAAPMAHRRRPAPPSRRQHAAGPRRSSHARAPAPGTARRPLGRRRPPLSRRRPTPRPPRCRPRRSLLPAAGGGTADGSAARSAPCARSSMRRRPASASRRGGPRRPRSPRPPPCAAGRAARRAGGGVARGAPGAPCIQRGRAGRGAQPRVGRARLNGPCACAPPPHARVARHTRRKIGGALPVAARPLHVLLAARRDLPRQRGQQLEQPRLVLAGGGRRERRELVQAEQGGLRCVIRGVEEVAASRVCCVCRRRAWACAFACDASGRVV